MNFSDLRTMARGMVPQAKVNVVSNTVRDLILNEGANKVAEGLLCLPTDDYFNVVAEQGNYNLASVVDRYIASQSSGLWWYNGSNWKQLNPRTREYMDKKFPFWKDDSSGDPQRFFIEEHKLVVHPEPDTAGTEYFRLYYFAGTQTMTSASHYPMGHDVEIVRLRGASWAILLYWRKTALKIIGKAEGNELILAEQDFDKEVELQRLLLNRKPELLNTDEARLKSTIV